MKKPTKPPPDVKCSHQGCRGAVHAPSCPVYLWAMEQWDIPLPDRSLPPRKRKRGRHPGETGEERLTSEQRSEIGKNRVNKGGRPRTEVPVALIETLRKGKFRVKAEYRNDDEVSRAAADLAGWSMERLAFVAAGRVHTRKAPSVVKAAQGIREEICEPIEKTMIHKGGIDLGNAVDRAMASAATPEPRPSDAEPSPAPEDKGSIQ